MAWTDTIATAVGSAMEISGKIADTIARLTTLERDIAKSGDDTERNYKLIHQSAKLNSQNHAKVMKQLGYLEGKVESLTEEVVELRKLRYQPDQ
jgi:hypothetical protein